MESCKVGAAVPQQHLIYTRAALEENYRGIILCSHQPGLYWTHFNLICIKVAWQFLAVLRQCPLHFHTAAWWQYLLRLVCWDTGWLMGLLLKTAHARALNLSVPWKRNPMLNAFCLMQLQTAAFPRVALKVQNCWSWVSTATNIWHGSMISFVYSFSSFLTLLLLSMVAQLLC